MNVSLWRGQWVRLAAENVETDAAMLAKWRRDSAYHRLADDDPAYPSSVQQMRRWFEETDARSFRFAIRTLSDDRLIGGIGLWIENWNNGEAWVGIGIGERDYWGKGYGSDAMRLMLRYAFTELNVWRVSLTALATNDRAVRSYEKCGFVREGFGRQAARYDGQYLNEIYMSILRDEWMMSDK